MADPTTVIAPAASALVQYGALGVICLLLTMATAWLVWAAFRKAAQNEADCRSRDEARQAEIAALRIEMSGDRVRLHDSIQNLADIARAIGGTGVDKQAHTHKKLFPKRSEEHTP